jgi:pimeloyl-ACP methyl ester carboxylesterase
MQSVTSKDGTIITYDRLGAGEPVVLISGGSVDKSSNAGLAELLAAHFTVYNYDRRGRGASGDTLPYSVEREVEDIEAVIDAAGGSAYLYGSSSGAALALEAARLLPGQVKKLALWEPPYSPDADSRRPPLDAAQTFHDLVAAGKRGEAAEYFMAQVVGMPADFVGFARSQPWWAAQEALAHTLEYDAIIMGDYLIPAERAASVKTPTIVIAGGADFGFMPKTAQILAGVMPHAQAHILEGQPHNVDPAVLAPAMTAFFSA